MQGAEYDAIVLAGGGARRLGGADKPMLRVAGRSLLDRVLEACADAECVAVVGPRRDTERAVEWRVEDPPGGGPAAALAAGLGVGRNPWVAVLAADLPFLDAETVHRLWTAAAVGAEHPPGEAKQGAVIIDGRGRDQWLAAVYSRAALESAIAALEAGGLAGLPLRRLVADLRLARVAAPRNTALDCDTWEDVRAAREIAGDFDESAHPDEHEPGEHLSGEGEGS